MPMPLVLTDFVGTMSSVSPQERAVMCVGGAPTPRPAGRWCMLAAGSMDAKGRRSALPPTCTPVASAATSATYLKTSY